MPSDAQDEAPPPEWVDESAAVEESITITHGDAGTEVKIEDPTFTEIVALVIVALVIVLAIWSAFKAKHADRYYKL